MSTLRPVDLHPLAILRAAGRPPLDARTRRQVRRDLKRGPVIGSLAYRRAMAEAKELYDATVGTPRADSAAYALGGHVYHLPRRRAS